MTLGPGEPPSNLKRRKFCSRSCSATFNNRGVRRHGKPRGNCKQCGKEKPRRQQAFCSIECATTFRTGRKIKDWLSGKHKGYTGKTMSLSKFVKHYLYETRGTACSICSWDERHPIDGSILTEIDHINGDASDTRPENLRILCPNCHSMTPTFRGRNRGNSCRNRILE